MENNKDLLTPTETCELFDNVITLETLAVWRARKRPPAYYKLNGHIYYSKKELLEWKENSKR